MWDIKNTNNKKYRTVRIIPFPVFTFLQLDAFFQNSRNLVDTSLLSLLKLIYLYVKDQIMTPSNHTNT